MTNEQHNVQIRNASLQDVDLLTDIEAACFPAAEAATREALPNGCGIMPVIFGY